MSVILISIISYASIRIIDQFLQEEGYGWLKKLFFPKEKYKELLVQIIFETINEFEQSKNHDNSDNKLPFYHSQILFVELNKHILSKKQIFDFDKLINLFKESRNIIVPTKQELTDFYNLFVLKVNDDKKLKNLYFDENYKSKIFELGNYLERIETKVDYVSEKVNDLHADLISKPYSIENYTPITDYILRQISTSIPNNIDFLTSRSTHSLYDIIVDKDTFPRHRYILYSGALTGKSTELKNVAYQLQKQKNQNPFLIDLNGFIPDKTFSRIIKTVVNGN
jgi:hypothetical protein